MSALIAYIIIHKTTVILSVSVGYVLAAGTQPPLDPNAGYYKLWAYRLFQAGAANFARFHPTVNASQPDVTVKGK